MQATFFLLVLYVVGAFVAIACILGILRISRPRVGSPTCVGCGYDLTGRVETASVCPECGRSLDAPGVIRSGQRRPLSTRRRILLLTVVVGAIGFAVTPPVDRHLAQRAVFLQTSTWTLPRSAGYRNVTVTGTVTSMRRPLPVASGGTVSIIDHDGVTHTLSFDRRLETASYPGDDGQTLERPIAERGNRTGEAIFGWMTGLALDAEPAPLRVEADSLAAYLYKPDNFLRLLPGEGDVPETIVETWPGMPYGNSTIAISQSAAPQPWRLPLLIAPWIVVWAIGVLLIAIRRPL